MTIHCFFWSTVMALTFANLFIARQRAQLARYKASFVLAVHQWAQANIFMLAAFELSSFNGLFQAHLGISTYGAFCIAQLLTYPLICNHIFREGDGK